MAYIAPIIPGLQVPGPNYLAENQVKADAFGSLTDALAKVQIAKAEQKKRREAKGRGMSLAESLSKFDPRFKPFSEHISEAYVDDSNKAYATSVDLLGLMMGDDTKRKLGELKDFLAKQKYDAARKRLTDATKKELTNYGEGYENKEKALNVLATYQEDLKDLGYVGEVVKQNKPGISGSTSRFFPGGDSGEMYVVEIKRPGTVINETSDVGAGVTEDEQLRIMIRKAISGTP